MLSRGEPYGNDYRYFLSFLAGVGSTGIGGIYTFLSEKPKLKK